MKNIHKLYINTYMNILICIPTISTFSDFYYMGPDKLLICKN